MLSWCRVSIYRATKRVKVCDGGLFGDRDRTEDRLPDRFTMQVGLVAHGRAGQPPARQFNTVDLETVGMIKNARANRFPTSIGQFAKQRSRPVEQPHTDTHGLCELEDRVAKGVVVIAESRVCAYTGGR